MPLQWEDRQPTPHHVGGLTVPLDDPPSKGNHWLTAEIDWDAGTVCFFDYLTEYQPIARPRVLLIHRVALTGLWPLVQKSRLPRPIEPLRGGRNPAIMDNPAVGATQRRNRRGPIPGTVRRYEASDRELFPEIERLMQGQHISATEAARRLAQGDIQGRTVAGAGTVDSRARRLACLYLAERSLQPSKAR
jgi:hypothetical protein